MPHTLPVSAPAIAPANWIRLIILGAMFGAAFMFVSIALEGVSPLMVVAARLSLGAVFLLGIMAIRGARLPLLSGPNAGVVWLSALGMALFSNAVPFFMLSWGQQYAPSSFAGVCMAIVPLLILPLAHLFVPGERMHLRRLIGFVIGTLGVFVLIGPAAFSMSGDTSELLARLAFVAAACCYAIGAIVTRLCPKVDMLGLSAAALTISAVIFVPYAFWVEDLPTDVPLRSMLALLYLGIFPTGLAQILLVQVIRSAGPVFMSLVNYQVPIWSVFLGLVVLGEDLPPGLFWALVLILSGMALAQFGALKRLFTGRRQR
ncbi:DMT family transporter [Rhodobacteraceae bacterium KMM 6894]|nr:DMT family transporter [Rhodobacteraceae bacterium KMM 6894]